MGYDDRIAVLRTDLQTLTSKANEKYADLEKKGAEATGEERTELANLIAEGERKRAELDMLVKLDANDKFANEPITQKAQEGRAGRAPERRKSWGEIVVDSTEYKGANKTSSTPKMDRVNVKAIYGSLDSAGGALVRPDRLDEVIDIPFRPITLLDMIQQRETTSDAVEYPLVASRTNNAAPVAERTSGAFTLKPESDMTFDLKTVAVKTIATWVAASRRILQDAPGLRATIDNDLRQMLQVELEDQIIAGDGTGENFLGILNTPGILTRDIGTGPRAEAGDTVADTIRRALTDVRLQFYNPTGVVLNPVDAETLELLKDTTGQYVRIWDVATGRLWRVPVAETAALPAGTGIVGDLMIGAILWDRMQTEIRVGEPNDFFVRNAVAILAELRAAFAVVRPKAVSKVNLIPAP